MHLRVVADVEVVVDLRRLGDGRRGRVAGRGVVVAGLLGVALARGGRRRRRAVAGRVRAVALGVGRDRAVRRDRPGQRQVDRGPQEFEDHLARQPDPLGIGLDLHPGLGHPRAGGHEDARAGDLDDAHPADVDRGEVLRVAQGRRVDALGPAGAQDRGPGGHRHGDAVDRQGDRRRRLDRRVARAACWPGRAG